MCACVSVATKDHHVSPELNTKSRGRLLHTFCWQIILSLHAVCYWSRSYHFTSKMSSRTFSNKFTLSFWRVATVVLLRLCLLNQSWFDCLIFWKGYSVEHVLGTEIGPLSALVQVVNTSHAVWMLLEEFDLHWLTHLSVVVSKPKDRNQSTWVCSASKLI